MPLQVMVYRIEDHSRSAAICKAFARGIGLCGDRAVVVNQAAFRSPVGDVAVFYGFAEKLPAIFAAYRAAGKPVVYVDLGYWGRTEGGKYAGYHKVSVNARHPTSYFQAIRHSADRISRFAIRTEKWKTGRHILVLGMGDKAAGVEGFAPEEWERNAIGAIRKVSDRPIVYRPKPSWKRAAPIQGVGYSRPEESLFAALRNCHAVVTHHSNAAVEALTIGVPSFAMEGVAVPLSQQDLTQIERPFRPDGREQWLADIGWCQWSLEEMRLGLAWRHLRNEGLIP